MCYKFYFSVFIILDYAHKLILRCDGKSAKDYRFAFRENTANSKIPDMGQGGRFYYFIGKCFWTDVCFDVFELFQCNKHCLCESFSSF